ncbi:acyl-CoA dehydratase activase-related protein [Bacteroides sp. 51]|uniref:acyl-CoA dehydratase activase-related protein n=1 Tax=Bacteroides sp. 51 TaxID=2302938 RepID=UPI0013D3492F|nr:acyl-CoA dehydratase activase-related protein [Bacteroides sp. 51]NDV83364.1 hypothetical protein [Bacteroides sp. 51]
MKTGNQIYRIGIDVGSTTLKVIALDDDKKVVYKAYTRHKADINNILASQLNTLIQQFPQSQFAIHITGSAGMGIAERIHIPFVQEIVASVEVVNTYYPDVRTMIDLGGEDAKMVFFHPGKQPDIRMNGSCAGGTGAFIDQMADLMNIPIEELGSKALSFEKIYPVASRCGVFAKTDVQNLICRNVPVSDIAASILHTVALQSITSLARGYDVEPKVLCVGGPLTFIPALREAFRELIGIAGTEMIVPDYGEYFPAWGCALLSTQEETTHDLNQLIQLLGTTGKVQKETLPELFHDMEAYEQWKKERKIKKLETRIVQAGDSLNCFLGIDSGSTTTKILITDEENRVVYTFYDSNEGNPLKKVIEGLQQFYDRAKTEGFSFRFVSSAVTGYGEDLVKSALNLDYGIVETMAHLSGAKYVDPEVSFVLDIGGQDMKSIFTRHGLISNIELNEACSSGCGSFLQNFASTMNVDLPTFSKAACLAKYPSDLGSRCTVFMNSKVKQALRESASLGDIAAGLAYSVVKNCLFKVLKISNLNALGDHIVVQGGTFRNDAVYRALELLSGKTVSSTDHPELMGAFGAALYAQQMWKQTGKETSFTGQVALPEMAGIATKELQCKGCTNKCTVLRFSFENGNVSYAGNKCEKVFFSKSTEQKKGINAFEKKNEILFSRTATVHQGGITIGIPRVLNMFENYPFWHTLFTGCGFNVVLSPESNFTLYQSGVGSVMSENICFPAKLVHGHILSLIEQKVDRIFYPIIPKEEKEFGCSTNSFNCPVVSGYPEVIRSSIDPEGKYGIAFDKPVILFSDHKSLEKACSKYCLSLGVSPSLFTTAFKAALKEKKATEVRIANEQKALLNENIKSGKHAFVVAGRPYHTDPLIHQKVGQILSDLGIDVFTDDVFRISESSGFGKLNIVSQWSYPNRVVQAAMEVAKLPQHIQLIQLNSFGCGPDSFFMDETTDVLKHAGKNNTILRIDEIASPGSIRLRLRSLIESLKAMGGKSTDKPKPFEGYKTTYKKEDRQKTILAPWFADFFSPFIPAIGELAGYKIVNMPKTSKISVEEGLKYGNNEVCYPSTLILGDIISTLKSGKYDLDDIVVAITQTGGQCRATNYIAQIKSGLQNAGFAHVPVLAVGSQAIQNEQKAFKVPMRKILNIGIYAVLYADALQQMYSTTVVRENKKGEAKEMFDFYVERGIEAIRANDYKRLVKVLEQAVADFNQISIADREYHRIGLVGEIFLKYNNYGQAYITDWLRSRNMEVDCPPIIDFLMQYFVNAEVNAANGIDKVTVWGKYLRSVFWKYINKRMTVVEHVMEHYRFHQPAESIYTKAEYASEVLDLTNQFGEGWMIAAEVACYARRGINRVVCVQPFGCIANHIVAKGIEKRLKKLYPDMSILYLDVDGGIAEVNLQNRLHFMIS